MTFRTLFLLLTMISSSCINQTNLENKRDCERALLMAKHCLEINTLKATKIDSVFSNLAFMDSVISTDIFNKYSQNQDFKVKVYDVESILDSLLNKSIFNNQNQTSSQIRPIFGELVGLDKKCDFYLAQIDNYIKKDSAYRKKLNLDLQSNSILFKANIPHKMEPNKLYSEFEIQIDSKINKVIKDLMVLNKSYQDLLTITKTE